MCCQRSHALVVDDAPRARRQSSLMKDELPQPLAGTKRSVRLKKPGLSRFARRLLLEWRRLDALKDAACVIVAVSGGADSTALLLALAELNESGRASLPRLVVAHLDHGLRDEAGRADALFVAELAQRLGYESKLCRAKVREQAAINSDNLEQAARRARYSFFAASARECGASVVLTAHTLDDQAETVLLRLLRGSGADGLGAMEVARPLAAESDALLLRPLLSWATRSLTQSYCRERGVEFRQDEMNDDLSFARVRVRKELLPLLRSFNGRICETLARTATLLREDAAALNLAAAELLAAASDSQTDAGPTLLRVNVLRAAPASLRRRALRQWLRDGRGHLRRLEMVHLLAVESLLKGERGGRTIELPGGSTVLRQRGRLQLQTTGDEKYRLLS
ncbi:MAG TPA: tRNA lysidine(34) synthetase TilS [Pyrinomonadaceae bacterium]